LYVIDNTIRLINSFQSFV